MTLTFHKYQGTGNDFILIDNRSNNFIQNKDLIKQLCDRRFGIGADGLILLNQDAGQALKMIYFNSDGNESSMCGNGGRCFVAFAKRFGMIEDAVTFQAIDGMHHATIISQTEDALNTSTMNVKLGMKDVTAIERSPDFIFMDTGSPHYVKLVENVAQINIVEEGRKIRYNARFKDHGTNVNFIEIKGETLHVRTYERGVEDETLSCGTGVTAAALAADFWNLNNQQGSCKILTPGGELQVLYHRIGDIYQDIFLQGPATLVFEGTIAL